ncbi:copper-binding protein [Variovorax sp. J31P207]|uniref:copper-binding protein n=1 Tax=Variovorax sp. J31P207 TaxID=3053510 RepID=UPI0025770172|nr:copper-binding protein [Variovorax sp. J31P207]MDM0064979.1 copper-binding protein [Variovorax sp. J31P207]
MFKTPISLGLLVSLLAVPGLATGQPSGALTAVSNASASDASELTQGEVRKVDKDGKKLTIKHGLLKNLEMPGMTMVFQVKDETVLDKVQVGDKVEFLAEKIDGKFTVTRLEPQR